MSDARSVACCIIDELSVTKPEIVFSATNAYVNSGIGTSIIVMDLLWFITTPTAMVGLGVTIGSVIGGIIATAGAGIFVVFVALPIACYAYKATTQASTLVANIKTTNEQYEKACENLFCTLLQIRAFFKDDDAFKTYLSNDLKRTQNEKKLAPLVNEFYSKLSLPVQENLRQKSVNDIENNNDNTIHTLFNANLKAFKSLFFPSITVPKEQMRKVIKDGVIGGIVSANVVLGSTWAAAAVMVGFGLIAAASIPVVGWAILGLTAAALVGFGIGIAYMSYKDEKRKILIEQLSAQQKQLETVGKECDKTLKEKKFELDQQPVRPSTPLAPISQRSVHDKISVCPEEIDFVSDRASRRRAARDPQHERKTKSIVSKGQYHYSAFFQAYNLPPKQNEGEKKRRNSYVF